MSHHPNQHPGRGVWSIRRRQQLAGVGTIGYGKIDKVDEAALRDHDQEMARQKFELLRRFEKRRR